MKPIRYFTSLVGIAFSHSNQLSCGWVYPNEHPPHRITASFPSSVREMVAYCLFGSLVLLLMNATKPSSQSLIIECSTDIR